MAVHPVAAAVHLLHQIVHDAVGDTVSVDLGPRESTTAALDIVAIGMASDEMSVVSGLGSQAGPMNRREGFDIGCLATSVLGGLDVLPRLARAYELVDLVAAAVGSAARPENGITWGQVSSHQAQWIETENGMHGAQVSFSVAVVALRPTGRRR